MATTQEVYEIIVAIDGDEKIDPLKGKVAAIAPAFDRARDASGRFVGGMKAVKAQVDDTDASIERFLKRSVQVGDGLDSVGKGGKGGGRALLEFSRAAEDAQYGIAGILNNIPGLVQAMGGSAGLVGVISLGVVGAYQLYRNWDNLTGLLGGGIPQPALKGPELLAANLKKATEEVEELGKKSSLTWIELQKLQTLQADVVKMKAEQKDNADFQNLMEGTSKGDQERGKAFTAALNEAGPKVAADELTGNLAEGKNAKGLVFNPVTRTLTTPEIASRDLIIAASRGDEMAANEIKKALKGNSSFAAKIDENAVGAEDARKQAEKDKSDRIDFEAEAAYEETQASIASMQKYQKEGRAAKKKEGEEYLKDAETSWDAELKAAKKSRSFVGKSAEEMTPAELLAKQEHDQTEAKITAATERRSWLGKEDEDLSPEEKIAKRRQDERDRAETRRADQRRQDQMGAPGLGDFIRDALLGGLSEGAVASQLAALGIDRQGQAELLMGGQQDAYNKLLSDSEGQATNSQTLAGGSALRDAIQGGVKNEPDLLQKQLDRLGAMEGYLQTIADRRESYTAVAG